MLFFFQKRNRERYPPQFIYYYKMISRPKQAKCMTLPLILYHTTFSYQQQTKYSLMIKMSVEYLFVCVRSDT